MPGLGEVVLGAAVVALVLPAAVPAGAAAMLSGSDSSRATVNRRLHDNRIAESSGLARSTLHRGLLYTHNDKGGGPVVFAVGRHGRTRAVLRVTGAKAHDWEDISTGPHHTLWVGDIGDNDEARKRIQVYRVSEPRKVHSKRLASTRFDFAYPDGPHNAEALLVRPDRARVFIATKGPSGGALYRAPKRLSTKRVNVLTRVRSVPATITAGAFARTGGRLVLRNYRRAWLYSGVHAKPRVVGLPRMPQGESVEFGVAKRLLAGSEHRHSAVWSVPTH